MICELCKSRSGRHNMSARCCQLRYLIGMPPARRQDYFKQYKREHGADAGKALVEEINEFKQQFNTQKGE